MATIKIIGEADTTTVNYQLSTHINLSYKKEVYLFWIL